MTISRSARFPAALADDVADRLGLTLAAARALAGGDLFEDDDGLELIPLLVVASETSTSIGVVLDRFRGLTVEDPDFGI